MRLVEFCLIIVHMCMILLWFSFLKIHYCYITTNYYLDFSICLMTHLWLLLTQSLIFSQSSCLPSHLPTIVFKYCIYRMSLVIQPSRYPAPEAYKSKIKIQNMLKGNFFTNTVLVLQTIHLDQLFSLMVCSTKGTKIKTIPNQWSVSTDTWYW